MALRVSKILVVDDEKPIVEFLEMGLSAAGYQVVKAYNGLEALQVIRQDQPDLCILDVMMPGYNGFDLCREIRRTQNIPIIFLTAKGEVDDVIRGLDLGANDYLVKPFSFKELMARISARLRDAKSWEGGALSVGDFNIDDQAHEITYLGKALKLSLTEYKLLHCLLLHKNQAMSKASLLDQVWGHDYFGDDNIVEVYIKGIRRKIGDDKFEVIQTVRGLGYKLVVEL